MQKLNAFSASLLMILNWEVLLTHWRDEKSCSGIQIHWRTEQSATTWSSVKENAEFCRWDRAMPVTGTDWETSGWKPAQQKAIWWCWWQKAQHEPAACPDSQEGKTQVKDQENILRKLEITLDDQSTHLLPNFFFFFFCCLLGNLLLSQSVTSVSL